MTTTALPALDGTYDLPAEAPRAFRSDGHALVRGLASPEEAAAYRPVVQEAALEKAWDKRPLEERDTYGQAFLQSFNLWQVDERIARFVLAARFARVAAALLGTESVRLYHDQALCKEPGGGRTPWHQDQNYWPFDRDASVTMWMPLVDVTRETGSMTFVSGSHRLGDLQGGSISDSSDAAFAAFIEEQGLRTCTYGAMRAGDATFHAGWTVHSAPPNPTDRLRVVMTVIYVADGTRVATGLSEAQDFDRKVWLGGTPPGEPIDGELNPKLC